LVDDVCKPGWLNVVLPHKADISRMKEILKKRKLVTVCEEANCPNLTKCWDTTSTFMIMGDTCTRGCKFCAIKTSSKGKVLDLEEPQKIADAVEEMKLSYVVITSVDRDDLKDYGSEHFASCIKKIKEKGIMVEVLIPDFNIDCLKKVVDAMPEVIAHNIETVKELQLKVRDPRAGYEKSLKVLKNVKKLNPKIFTKSSIMLGLGETKEQVVKTMKDLRSVGCDILTLGQYLKPNNKFLKVEGYIKPEIFEEFKKIGEQLGFVYVVSGPLVRSSYKAGELFIKNVIKNG